MNNVCIMPGSLYASAAGCVITTLVGSGVTVILWSSRRRVGGMNHFVLPRQTPGERSPRFGETALAMLLVRMEVLGCQPDEIEARIYGGAHLSAPPVEVGVSIGEQNVTVARQFARAHGLRVVDEHVGGMATRRIAVDIETGHVAVTAVEGG